MKNGYVYCLRFRSTQFYIGSSNNPERRLVGHRIKCFGKKPDNKFMSNVWKKYGEPELYILAKVPAELLLQEEQKFIDLVFGKEGCLNLNPYADRPNPHKTPEHQAKISASLKGKKRSAETKAKLSAIQRERSGKAKAVIGTKGNETIEFPSVRQASEFIGRDHKGIIRAIKHDGQSTSGGWTWRYK